MEKLKNEKECKTFPRRKINQDKVSNIKCHEKVYTFQEFCLFVEIAKILWVGFFKCFFRRNKREESQKNFKNYEKLENAFLKLNL